MKHLGSALLEGGVNEAQVGVVLGLRVHAGADEPLDSDLNRLSCISLSYVKTRTSL